MNWRDTGKIARIFGGALRAPALGTAFAFAVATMGNGIGARAQQAAPVTTPASAGQATAPAQAGQDIAGIWQGTLTPPNAPKGVRFVIKIVKDSSGALKASLYNADQGSQPLNFTTVTLQGADVKLASPPLSIGGKLSADGNTIDGNWGVDGPHPIAVSFARTAPDAAWPIPEPVQPMAADAHPGIDVATVKPTDPSRPGKLFTVRGTHSLTLGTNLNDLLAFAYGVHTKQIIGAPDWSGTDRFDIDIAADMPGRPGISQMRELLKKLLTDRFELKVHNESRDLSVYAITVAPGGPKLTATKANPTDLPNFIFRGLGDLFVTNMTIKDVADGFQTAVMDRPVVDHTGLTGRYDFALKWTPDDSQFAQFRNGGPAQPAAGDNSDAPPSLYTALQEDLGLKMEATKAPDDVIVIDHVEKPSPN
jgi:uncharacterized protein (TIGR03435 family)